MNLILLPGNVASNRHWIEEVEQSLRPNFSSANIQFYRHWQTGDDLIDLDHELKELFDKTSKLSDYLIFAKSAGVVLSVKGICEGKIKPERCIFVGTPILWAIEKGFDFDRWITSFSVPTLFIQRENDPAMPADKLKDYLNGKGVTNYKFVKIPGASHDYPDIEQLNEFVLGFLKRH